VLRVLLAALQRLLHESSQEAQLQAQASGLQVRTGKTDKPLKVLKLWGLQVHLALLRAGLAKRPASVLWGL
jgi:hypothetical protein